MLSVTDKENRDPKQPMPKTGGADSSRAQARTEEVLPVYAELKTERERSRQANARMDSDGCRLQKSTTDRGRMESDRDIPTTSNMNPAFRISVP